MQNEKENLETLHINGLSAVAEQYNALLIDAWGVLHDGKELYPGVAECLDKLHQKGIPVVVISNAARRADTVFDGIVDLGVSPHSLYAAISSGEVFWQSVRDAKEGFDFSGKSIFYYGPTRSLSVLEGLELSLVSNIRDADIIVNTGTISGVDSLDEDLTILQSAVEKDIPMVCINPDLVAIRAGIKGFSAGSIAEKYSELGASDVRWVGKPHKEIYQAALALLPEELRSSVLAVGDALRTDIEGARGYKLDSLFIAGGIHHEECDPDSIENMQKFFSNADATPNYYCRGLTW